MLQNYVIIDTQSEPNYCDNIVLWDGDTNKWNLPPNHIALSQNDTPTKIWEKANSNTWILVDSIGQGGIGWEWDGTYLITNQPMPVSQNNTTSGTETF